MGTNDRRRREAAQEDEEDLIASANEYLDRGVLRGCSTEQGCWMFLPENGKWIFASPAALSNTISEFSNPKFKSAVLEVMKERGMEYMRVTSSYFEQPKDTFNLMNRDRWIEADLDATSYHWFFDVFMQSLGGNKQENIEHIEHCIGWKYWNPKDSHHLPCLLIHGEGGVGKNLLVNTLLYIVFGGQTVSTSKRFSVSGQFNSILESMAVCLIDEGAEGASNEMKITVGNRFLIINTKMVKEYQADNTAWFVVSSNSDEGGIWLDRTDADRRYSVVKVREDETLAYWVARHNGYEKPTAEQLKEARQWIRTEVDAIITNPVEVAKWLGCLVNKYADKGIPHALHGADYQALMDVQEPIDSRLIRTIFTDPSFTHIEQSAIYRAYYSVSKEHGKRPINDRPLYARVAKYLEKNAPHIVKKRVHQGNKFPELWIDTTKPLFRAQSPNTDSYINHVAPGIYQYVGPDLV